MEYWLSQFAPHAPYVILVGILVVSGFGLPIPEDIPLIIGGYLSATGYADPWIMFPMLFAALLGADAIVFHLGRRYGRHVPRIPILRRYLSERRLRRTEHALNVHGGKFIFIARFLPGLRTPAMFTAGTFKVPYWKFLLYDGSAATMSVPLIFFLAYFFEDQISRVKDWVAGGQIAAIGAVLLVIAVIVVVKLLFKRRIASAGL